MLKISELDGELLDLAVAKCEGYKMLKTLKEIGEHSIGEVPAIFRRSDNSLGVVGGMLSGSWNPHENWSITGLIVERELVDIFAPQANDNPKVWYANHEWGPLNGFSGKNPLVAALRCYVAKNFGETIELDE